MCWTQPYTGHKTKTNKTKNTPQYVLDSVQHILCCVFCFVFLRLVSCVWLCPTHIVVCFLFCLFSAFLDCPFLIVPFGILCQHNHTQDTRRRKTKQKTHPNMCWTQPYTGHKTKTNKTKNTPQYVLDTTIHRTQDEDKQNKKHTTICDILWCVFCLSSSCVLCMAVSNTYCGVFFVFLRLVSCVWLCPTHIVLCFLFCLSSKNKTKNTPQYVLDTTIHRIQDEEKQNKKHITIFVGHHYSQTNTNDINNTYS
jgi:hypothetical protein